MDVVFANVLRRLASRNKIGTNLPLIALDGNILLIKSSLF